MVASETLSAGSDDHDSGAHLQTAMTPKEGVAKTPEGTINAADEENASSRQEGKEQIKLKTAPSTTTMTLHRQEQEAAPNASSHLQSQETSRQTPTTSTPSSPQSRSMVSSIFIQQTNETLQVLQRNLHHAKSELLRSLGHHLSQLPQGASGVHRQSVPAGITLPASAIGWLAASRASISPTTTPPSLLSGVLDALPRLTHLRVTVDQWPTNRSIMTTPASGNLSSPIRENSTTTSGSTRVISNNDGGELLQQHASLQYFHRLRYSPSIDVSMFSDLQVLLLDQVPPSWVHNLCHVASTLQVLRVERACLYDLQLLLLSSLASPIIEDCDYMLSKSSTVVYSQLTHLKLSHCNLGEMTRGLGPPLKRKNKNDDNNNNIYRKLRLPLARMPQLKSVDFAHNDIRSERTALGCGIANASQLSILDLSYNQIPSLVKAPLSLGNLQTLLLTGNHIKSAEGIDRLYALKTLALDDNQIASWTDVAGLARLPELHALKLKGNPFMVESKSRTKLARVMLLDVFREQRFWGNGAATFRELKAALPVIDGKPASSSELKALQQRAFVTVTTEVPAIASSRDGEARDVPSGSASGTDQQRVIAQNKMATAIERGEVKSFPRKKRKNRRQASRAIIEDEEPHAACFASASLARSPAAAASPFSPYNELVKRTAISISEDEKEELCDQQIAKLSSPKLSFTVNELFSSLGHDNGATRTQEKHGKTENEKIGNSARSIDCKEKESEGIEKAKDPIEDFEWPQPISYLPENNLYKEFEWNHLISVSLSENKNAKGKQKRRKDKTSRSKKLRQKQAPSISPASSGDGSLSDTPDSNENIPKNGSSSVQNGVAKAPSSKIKSSPPRTKKNGQASSVAANSDVGSLSRASATAKAEADLQELEVKIDNDDSSAISYRLRSVSFEEDVGNIISPNSITGSAFPAIAMDAAGADDAQTCSSLGTNRSGLESRDGESKKTKGNQDLFHLAEQKSKFLGMEQERKLKVMDNMELYWKTFVFPDFVPNIDAGQLSGEGDNWQSVFFRYPRIQMLSRDRESRESMKRNGACLELHPTDGGADREQFVRVWRENVVACGKPALRRLPPNRIAHFGFHGDLSWQDGKVRTVSECRQVILCLSNTSFYVILDNDSLTAKEKAPSPRASAAVAAAAAEAAGTSTSQGDSPTNPRTSENRKFPSPIPQNAAFEEALWPHAVACHPLNDIVGITIGFGFQRMAIRVRNTAYPSAVDFTYQLLTSNKMKTVELLQEIQNLVKEVRVELGRATLEDDAIKIDNDDKLFLDGVAAAVAPEPLGAVLGVVLVKQRWKHGQRGAVSRICVVSDSKIFLLDEDYVGDGSVSVDAGSGRRLGSPTFRLIDAADLQQISEVRAADADPNTITIVIRPTQLLRTHRWRLVCRDRTGAEKLVEDVRKGMSLVE